MTKPSMIALLAALTLAACERPASTIPSAIAASADKLVDAAMQDTMGYHRLAAMTDSFGNRLSGSAALEQTIDWLLVQMQLDSLANVHGEQVMVPHWIRGQESAVLTSPRQLPLHMLGLGGSIATPVSGISAPVYVVSSFDDLKAHAADVKGKIVLFDFPFPKDVSPFEGYRIAVQYRGTGAVEAAKLGAVAALIRSVASQSIRSPHTGGMHYDTTVTKIPTAALSVEDAELLHRMQDRGDKVTLTLHMEAHTDPDVPSRNVIAELRGSEKPDEIVVIGGHIDSWDVGQGAMDDGGGSVAAWEAVRLIKELGLHPKRTIRVVLFTNEENGTRGGKGYFDAHQVELGKHVAAIESDNGVFKPFGFRFQGSADALTSAREIGALLARIGATKVEKGDGEADVSPIIGAGVPGFALDVDGSKYFWYHHSDGDMMTVIDRDDYRRCIATLAVMAYVLADRAEPLPRGGTQ